MLHYWCDLCDAYLNYTNIEDDINGGLHFN